MDQALSNEQTPVIEAAAPVEQSAPQTVESHIAAKETTSPATQAAQAYSPNFKFKVMDKEHEIPESFRAIVKDAQTEKEARELFEKAYGLEHVKTDRDTIRNQLKEYRGQVEPIVNTFQTASQSYTRAMAAMETGNVKQAMVHLQDAFGALKVPDKVLKQYVYNMIQMEELPPEQKSEYNNYRELERQSYLSQQQLAMYQSQIQQLSVQQRTSELNQALSKPEVASFVQSFDQRNGPGSFTNEVIMRGQYYAQARGEDKSAESIVQELLQRYGMGQSQPASPVAAPVQQAVAPAAKPVIPTVAGAGNPIKRKISSVEDIEKAYKEL